MVTSEERAELRRLLGEATEGPWVQGWPDAYQWVAFCDDAGEKTGDDQWVISSPTSKEISESADAALIVALRNNAEALLDTADSRDEWRSAAIGAAFEAVLPGYEPTPADVTTGIAALRQYGTHRAQEAERLKAERDQLRTENDRLKAKLERVEAVLKDWEDDWTCNDSIPSVLHDFQAALKDPHV